MIHLRVLMHAVHLVADACYHVSRTRYMDSVFAEIRAQVGGRRLPFGSARTFVRRVEVNAWYLLREATR